MCFVAHYRQLVAEIFISHLKPVPGVPELLAALPQAKAVVSSAPTEKIRQALSITGLEGFFGDNIYSSYALGIWKPDPEIYSFAARDMGYQKKQCIAVEDSTVGLIAAAESGIRTFFLNRFDEECEREDVTVIQSMSQLQALI